MSRRDGRNDAPAAAGSRANAHLSDEQLLLGLDGELSPRERARVGEHLQECWSCRARSAQFGEAITHLVEYRDRLISSCPPVSPGSRTMFGAYLEQLARNLQRPSLRVRLAALFREICAYSRGMVPRYLWMSSITIATFILFWFLGFREAPTVPDSPQISVKQLLAYAQAAEVRALSAVTEPVVYQKLRIQISNHDVTRTIYRDMNGRRRADRLIINNDSDENPTDAASSNHNANRSGLAVVEKTLQQTFRESRLNWEDPLSLVSYRSWRDSLGQKVDEVMEQDAEFVTLKTTTIEGPVSVASITIRTADFHPVAGHFHLMNMRHVEMDELDWQVIPLEAVNPAIFEDAPAVPASIAPPITAFSVGPTDADLAESELQARVALHSEKADLGEEIELDRNTANLAERSVILRGLLTSPERKDKLFAALHGIPNLELQLRTVEEATAQESPAARQEFQEIGPPQLTNSSLAFSAESAGQDSRDIPKLIAEESSAGRLPFNETLQEYFPDIEQRTAFVNRVINLTQNAFAQAWALRRLSDRYTPQEVAHLSRGSSRTLELLIHDHVLALRLSVDEAQQLISPLLRPEAITAQHDFGAPLPPPMSADDWRVTVTDMFREVQEMHSSVAVLFGQPGQIIPDQQARIRELRLSLIKLEAYLPFLHQHVSGSFLSGTKHERVRLYER